MTKTQSRVIALNQTELRKKHIVEEYCNKQMKAKIWAERLWVSTRQFLRVVKSYKIGWDFWLIHKLKWKESNHHKDFEKEDWVRCLLREDQYYDYWPTMIAEEAESRGIEVSDERVRQFMIREWLRENKKQREMKIRENRTRKWSKWEMIQYDGSYHRWFEDRLDEEFCMLVAIDDATGEIMQLRICDNEWWESAVIFWKRYMRRYGIPEIIYVDRHATYKVNHPKATDDRKLITEFDRCLKKLSCELIPANSPQAKWRVERCNQTLQDRLVKMMRKEGINDVDSANKYIEEVYIPWHNGKFAKKARIAGDRHRELTAEEVENLDWIFSVEETRSLRNDYTLQYQNRTFQLDPRGIMKLYPKTKCKVQENVTWGIQIIANEKTIPYKEIDTESRRINEAIRRTAIRAKKERQNKELMEARKRDREESRHIISKQKQIQWRTEQTLEKARLLRMS